MNENMYKRGKLVALDHADYDEYWITALIRCKEDIDLNALWITFLNGRGWYTADRRRGNYGRPFARWLRMKGLVEIVNYDTFAV